MVNTVKDLSGIYAQQLHKKTQHLVEFAIKDLELFESCAAAESFVDSSFSDSHAFLLHIVKRTIRFYFNSLANVMIIDTSENYILVLSKLAALLDDLEFESGYFNYALLSELERLNLKGCFFDVTRDLLNNSNRMKESLSDAKKLVRETLSNMRDV